jgi:hypothetical protein
MDDLAKQESEIAILVARIKSSSLLSACDSKEPFDRTINGIPLAYAFFQVLVEVGECSGNDQSWNEFLVDALHEVIQKSEESYTN